MIKDATPYFEFMYLVDLSFCGGNKFPEEPKFSFYILEAYGLLFCKHPAKSPDKDIMNEIISGNELKMDRS